jgi:hypothetical protein
MSKNCKQYNGSDPACEQRSMGRSAVVDMAVENQMEDAACVTVD